METKIKELKLNCDKCKEPIRKLDSAWVEWVEPIHDYLPQYKDLPDLGFRIVHSSFESMLDPIPACRNDNFDKSTHTLREISLYNFLHEDRAYFICGLFLEKVLQAESVLTLAKRLEIPEKEMRSILRFPCSYFPNSYSWNEFCAAYEVFEKLTPNTFLGMFA